MALRPKSPGSVLIRPFVSRASRSVVALFGLRPAWTGLGWAAVGVFLFITDFGPFLQFPGWVMDVSPYWHVPHLPGAALTWQPLLWLVAVAAALTTAGLAGFRRRDIG